MLARIKHPLLLGPAFLLLALVLTAAFAVHADACTEGGPRGCVAKQAYQAPGTLSGRVASSDASGEPTPDSASAVTLSTDTTTARGRTRSDRLRI